MKGAIELASSEPSFYSRLFVTPKVTGSRRPVVDFVHLSHFCMETSLSVLHSLRPGDWMISIDLQDAYLQVQVHPESRRYLRFCLGHQTFQFRVLCFGLSSAPQVFMHVMAPISSIMHRFGHRILRYLDNWLVLGSSLQEITWARDFLLWLCGEWGVQVNFSKSSLTPTQTLDYLGMTLQSTPLRAFLTQARIRKVLSLVDDFSSREQPLRLWRYLLGVMSSMSALLPGSLLRMRSLQLRLNVASPQSSEDALISWDDSCLLDLRWWSVASYLEGGVSFDLPHPHLLLFIDASDSGWGASLGEDCLSGLWSQDVLKFSINHRELLAVLLAIRGFLHLLRGLSVTLFTDNTTTLAYLRKEGGGGHAVFQPQCGGSGYPSPLRGERSLSAPSVCSGTAQRPGRLPESGLPSPGLRMDPLPGGPSGALKLAGHHRPVCHLPEPPSSGLFFTNGGSTVGGD